ncbi:MAG: tol-pal system-associated acyl-CoA thioesterase [Jannaschia sp.]
MNGVHRWPVRVYYEDTDLAGLVYYANYLKFIERARSEMVRTGGIDQAAMRAEGLVFVVTRVVADYLSPARYDDALMVETRIGRTGKARFVMAQEVLRDETILFRAEVTIACLDMGGRPRRLPAGIAEMAAAAETGPGTLS